MDITKRLLVALALVWLQGAFAAEQSQESALTCADFRPTDATLERYPELVGACEGIVERNGELFGKFKAVIRRPGNRLRHPVTPDAWAFYFMRRLLPRRLYHYLLFRFLPNVKKWVRS